MTYEPAIADVLCLFVLIGGPAYLIGKAVERRRARKAEAWWLSPAGFQHHAMVTSSRVDSLGPLSFAEHEALLFNAGIPRRLMMSVCCRSASLLFRAL